MFQGLFFRRPRFCGGQTEIETKATSPPPGNPFSLKDAKTRKGLSETTGGAPALTEWKGKTIETKALIHRYSCGGPLLAAGIPLTATPVNAAPTRVHVSSSYQAPEVHKMTGTASYVHEYNINTGGKKVGAWQVRHMMVNQFGSVFPMSGCGVSIQIGETCTLRMKNLGSFPSSVQSYISGFFPVKVVGLHWDGFTLASQQGHIEGPGRTIRFQVFKNSQGNLRLKVTAQGRASSPIWHNKIAKAVNFKATELTWGNCRDRIQDRIRWI